MDIRRQGGLDNGTNCRKRITREFKCVGSSVNYIVNYWIY